MRALALYYSYVGNRSLATLAGSIREEQTAKSRRAFKLRDFRGVDQEVVAKLETMGIGTAEEMVEAGRTPRARRQLAEQAGISPEAVLELVKLSDLSRLPGVKGVRARLYYNAGLDSPGRFGEWEPDTLHEMLVAFVERTGFEGIAPLPKEVRSTIASARKLRTVVEYA
jgi:hypothetical protein